MEEHLHTRCRPSPTWIYRGLPNYCWALSTTLDRVTKRYGMTPEERRDLENGLLRKFKRHYQQYSHSAPSPCHPVEWLSIMQHHGAPTRLMDWTYSPHVALYFALDESDSDASVWAINHDALIEQLPGQKELPSELRPIYQEPNQHITSDMFRNIFCKDFRFVCPITPYEMNQRLTIQQGLFLCPGDVSASFQENLAAVQSNTPIIKYVIPNDIKVRKKILFMLQRMNMNAATLFPGLDGFARSLKTLSANGKEFLAPTRT